MTRTTVPRLTAVGGRAFAYAPASERCLCSENPPTASPFPGRQHERTIPSLPELDRTGVAGGARLSE